MASSTRSRATRLRKHWAYFTQQPVTLDADQYRYQDLLAPWRGAFGTSSAMMTTMRLIGTMVTDDANLSDGAVGLGIIRGAINATPTAKPLTVGVDDFTDWVFRRTHFIFVGGNDPFHSFFDIRAMRKFDASRETLWAVVQSGSQGGANYVKVAYDVRILCGD